MNTVAGRETEKAASGTSMVGQLGCGLRCIPVAAELLQGYLTKSSCFHLIFCRRNDRHLRRVSHCHFWRM